MECSREDLCLNNAQHGAVNLIGASGKISMLF